MDEKVKAMIAIAASNLVQPQLGDARPNLKDFEETYNELLDIVFPKPKGRATKASLAKYRG